MSAGRILELDNFAELRGWGWPKFKKMSLRRQDKGHRAEIQAFVDSLRRGGPSPIPHEELIEVSRVTIDVAEALRAAEG